MNVYKADSSIRREYLAEVIYKEELINTNKKVGSNFCLEVNPKVKSETAGVPKNNTRGRGAVYSSW